MTKLQNPFSYPTPLTPGIHEMLIACGFTLTSPGPLRCVYESEQKRLTFSDSLGVTVEQMQGYWQVVFRFEVKTQMPEFNVMEILQLCDAIDYTQLPEYKEMISEVKQIVMNQKSIR